MIDASIYGLIQNKRPMANPMEQAGQMMQIRHLMGQNELQGLQRGELERGIREKGQLRDLFARGNVKPEDVMAIDPTAGMAFRKTQLDAQKSEADLAKTRAETTAKNMAVLRDLAAQATDDAGFRVLKEATFRLFGPEQAARVPDRFDPEAQKRMVMTADQLIERLSPKLTMTDTGGNIQPTNPYSGAPAGSPIVKTQTPAEVDASQRGWAQLNRPQFSEERGWVTPPPVGPRTAPFASAPSGPAVPPSPAPRAPAAPTAAPTEPFVPKSELDRRAKLEAEKPKALQRVENAQAKAAVVESAVDEALKQAKNFRWFGQSTFGSGLRRAAGSFVPGSDAYDLDKTIDTLKANLGFQELQAMREASPTGGALGQVAVEELRMLQSTVASLSVGQGQEQLEKNLAKIKTHFSNWKEAVRKHYEQQYSVSEQKPSGSAAQPRKRPSLKDILG